MPLRNIKNGKFIPTPKGTKTSLMKKVEKRIGHSLKKDWDEYYWKKNWGLKKMASKWGIKRLTLRGSANRRGWVGILGLKIRKESTEIKSAIIKKNKQCEICGNKKTKLQKSHFIRREIGGPACFFNILELCPNCHDRLDNEDKKIIQKAKKILLSRAQKALTLRLPPWLQ